MGKKRIDTTEEYLKNLKACINCSSVEECKNQLPFPNCLSDCCKKWSKNIEF